MVVAWLRGLLKPNYPFGVQSIVRENILLDSLDKELHGHSFHLRSQIEAATLSILAPMAAKKSYALAVNWAKTGSALLHNQDSATIQQLMRAHTMSSPEEAIAAFELLKATPIFEELQETMRAAEAEGILAQQ